MTPYELQDLISTWVNHAMTRMRFWVSITFAVIAAGFVVGSELSLPLLGFIILIYTVVTIVAAVLTRIALMRTRILMLAEKKMCEADESVSQFVPAYVQRGVAAYPDSLTPLYLIVYAGTVFYLLSRAGAI